VSEFDKAKAKFEKRRIKVNPALPWAAVREPEPQVKPVEQPRPRPKTMEVTINGPVDLRFEIDWVGTLMGGQMNAQSLKVLLIKQLAPLGRVVFK
jgi:hypothetical protein